MGDVAGVDDEGRPFRQGVHPSDRQVEGGGHVGIGLLGEADMAVTELDEERRAQPVGGTGLGGLGKIEAGQDATGEGKERPGAEAQTLERAAPG